MSEPPPATAMPATTRRPRAAWTPLASRARELLAATLAVACAVALGIAAEPWVSVANTGMLLLVAVVAVAVRAHRTTALYTALLSFVAFNFFFTVPHYRLAIERREDVVSVAAFLLAALLSSQLAARLREQMERLSVANARTRTIEELTRLLAAASDEPTVLRAGVGAIATALAAPVLVLRSDEAGMPTIVAASAGAAPLDEQDRLAAARFLGADPPAARTVELPAATWWFAPQRRGDLIGIRFERALPGPDELGLATAMAEDVIQAAERARLAADLARARLHAETEQLRGALLASVSHDLRTPLAAMIGAATSLSAYERQLSDADRRALLETILAESQRLDRYIQNLLDMTRLGHGALTLNRDWIGADEIVGATVDRMRRFFPHVNLRVRADPDLPLVYVHPALVEQALFNVVENAAKFSPAGAAVTIELTREDSELHIDVSDAGPGIPQAERERIFDRFYSVARGDRGGDGTGLGLAICRGMIGAHGGRVEASDGPEGAGTRMRLTLPLLEQPAAERPES